MMSCAGNTWLETPAMDYIAENGIRFTRAYTTNPVCSPARVSLMTGRFPGYFSDEEGKQARENGGSMRITEVSDEVRNKTIAAYLEKAGYELAYGGKEHLPPSLRPASLGFKYISEDERDVLAAKAAEYIRSSRDKPYFLVVSLINPHDICYMAIRDFANSESSSGILERGKVELATLDSALAFPQGVSEEEFFEKYCPPLPPNFDPQEDEPEAIAGLLDQRSFRRRAREGYSEEQWRHHRWAYCRLTEFVDAQVQVVLDALRESGQEENTLVIFSSDHGDNDASHRMEHKTVLYEESANIPFLAMWKGHIPAGKVDNKHLVSNGLDLLPTLCDYAGIEGKSDPRGRSLRPLFEGAKVKWRETLGVESEIGRMVVHENGLKYIRYDAAGFEEQLLDLQADPYEKKHFTSEPGYMEALEKLRRDFDMEWFSSIPDQEL
jgi:choline-sulfatase